MQNVELANSAFFWLWLWVSILLHLCCSSPSSWSEFYSLSPHLLKMLMQNRIWHSMMHHRCAMLQPTCAMFQPLYGPWLQGRNSYSGCCWLFELTTKVKQCGLMDGFPFFKHICVRMPTVAMMWQGSNAILSSPVMQSNVFSLKKMRKGSLLTSSTEIQLHYAEKASRL
jgi:hypothetical protein